MKTVIFYINGILTFPGEAKNWNSRAVSFTHVNSEARAEKVEYFCGPIGKVIEQRSRAERLNAAMHNYSPAKWNIDLVGHSNGADVICDTLKNFPFFPKARHVHLVCGACEADFDKNGLNRLLTLGRIDTVTCYVAGRDWALRLAHSWAGKVLGYGVLGLKGPVNVARGFLNERVRVLRGGRWWDYGHSDCWSETEFGRTMDCFLREKSKADHCKPAFGL